jgi:iron complex transport system ATP-binding protein
MKLKGQGISLRYGAQTVLDGIDIALDQGELVGLIGPNGAGKTTLLRVLAGLQKADAGRVLCDGTAIEAISPRDFARSVAYLAQSGEVHWPMHAQAVVALGRLPHRASQADDDAAIARAMQATNVAAFAGRAMDTLSGGERMRVLLARALAVEASLLLADEPVAALDPLHQLRVMALLQATARGGAGVMAVLHDLSLAARYCDRLVLIAEGCVIAQGSPADVLQPVHLKRAYGVEMISGSADGIAFVLPRLEIDGET